MALLLSRECLVMNASNSFIFIRFDVFAVVAVAKLVERPFKDPSKRCDPLTEEGLNESPPWHEALGKS